MPASTVAARKRNRKRSALRRKQTIIRLRETEHMTFERIGKRLGVSRQRIHQIWKKARENGRYAGQNIGSRTDTKVSGA